MPLTNEMRNKKYKRNAGKVHANNLRMFVTQYGMSTATAVFNYSDSALRSFMAPGTNCPEWLNNQAGAFLERYQELKDTGREPELTYRDVAKPDAFLKAMVVEFPDTVMGQALKAAYDKAKKAHHHETVSPLHRDPAEAFVQEVLQKHDLEEDTTGEMTREEEALAGNLGSREQDVAQAAWERNHQTTEEPMRQDLSALTPEERRANKRAWALRNLEKAVAARAAKRAAEGKTTQPPRPKMTRQEALAYAREVKARKAAERRESDGAYIKGAWVPQAVEARASIRLDGDTHTVERVHETARAVRLQHDRAVRLLKLAQRLINVNVWELPTGSGQVIVAASRELLALSTEMLDE